MLCFFSLHSIDFFSPIVLFHWVVMIHKHQEKVRVCDGYFFSHSLVLLRCIRVRVLNANNTATEKKEHSNFRIFFGYFFLNSSNGWTKRDSNAQRE